MPMPDEPAASFFARLPLLAKAVDTFDPAKYAAAPDDWALVVTDIVDSTLAIESGATRPSISSPRSRLPR
jgi:hypothetical protein